MDATSPTARALLCLEVLQDHPGITADRLAERLGVSERAARRYVAVLREAGLPIESVRGRYGGYRVGRGLRLRPLMFSTAEALGLVMAVLEGGHTATDANDPVQTALGKIIRVLPEAVAGPAERLRAVGDLLGWSHTRDARRLLRLDRVAAVEVLEETFVPPDDLDPVPTVDEHLHQGWDHEVEVLVDAGADEVARWVPRSLGRLEPLEPGRCRLVATTSDPSWYAAQLTALQAPYRILGSAELQQAARRIGRRLAQAGGAGEEPWPG